MLLLPSPEGLDVLSNLLSSRCKGFLFSVMKRRTSSWHFVITRQGATAGWDLGSMMLNEFFFQLKEAQLSSLSDREGAKSCRRLTVMSF